VSNIAFFHIGSNNRPATEYVVKNIRSFHPKSPYLLASDNALSFFDIAQENKTDYVHYNEKEVLLISPLVFYSHFLRKLRIARYSKVYALVRLFPA
jgi:hypothetical protein